MKSETKQISNGVPQGSFLGPLLFQIYINDIPKMNDLNKAYSMLYADDLTTFFIFKKPGKVISQAKRYLSCLERWQSTASPSHIAQIPPFLVLPLIPLCFHTQTQKIRKKCINRLSLIKILSHKN